MAKQWIRFCHRDKLSFGTLHGSHIAVYEGDMFADVTATGEVVPLDAVHVDLPCLPTKMICLWNNFKEAARVNKIPTPESPLYLIKAPNAYIPNGHAIRRPAGYVGRIAYEGELGIVIGRPCRAISEAEASAHIFGYTCVNDVTALDILKENPTFDQWTRAKGFDTFAPFGPCITTDIDPMSLRIRTLLNGEEKQNYPVEDMFFPPVRLVSLLSHYMTLLPGDVISCGTSLGVSAMTAASNEVEVVIEGVGRLSNPFLQSSFNIP